MAKMFLLLSMKKLHNGASNCFTYRMDWLILKRNTIIYKCTHVHRYREIPHIILVHVSLLDSVCRWPECIGGGEKAFLIHAELPRGRYCRKTGLNLSQMEQNHFFLPLNQQEQLQTVRRPGWKVKSAGRVRTTWSVFQNRCGFASLCISSPLQSLKLPFTSILSNTILFCADTQVTSESFRDPQQERWIIYYDWHPDGIFDSEEVFTGKLYATWFKEHVFSEASDPAFPGGVNSQQVTFQALWECIWKHQFSTTYFIAKFTAYEIASTVQLAFSTWTPEKACWEQPLNGCTL